MAPGAGPVYIIWKKILVLECLSMKVRVLEGLLLGRTKRRADTSGFELMLAPSRENPGHYAIRSVKEIDRRTAYRTLRSFGLAGVPPLLPSGSILEGRHQGVAGETGSGPRITFVRLTARQAMRRLATIRKKYPHVRKLYAHLEAKGLEPIGAGARGAVMRACAADGAAHGEGIVIDLPHRRADGAKSSFHVSITDWTAGGGGLCEVKAHYEIRRGERVETYELRDGRVRAVERARTPTLRD